MEMETEKTTPLNPIAQLEKDLFIAQERLNGFTASEALKNYECQYGIIVIAPREIIDRPFNPFKAQHKQPTRRESATMRSR
jgi:hypothetical protein